ncbi:MAG: hypothetical protein IJU92_10005, partial [Spirochaetaceae bacterium]|nr:hypothetical protein [Spirochaetaceae bacterium]
LLLAALSSGLKAALKKACCFYPPSFFLSIIWNKETRFIRMCAYCAHNAPSPKTDVLLLAALYGRVKNGIVW